MNVKKLDLEGNDIGSEGTLYIADMLRENLTITDLVSLYEYRFAFLVLLGKTQILMICKHSP